MSTFQQLVENRKKTDELAVKKNPQNLEINGIIECAEKVIASTIKPEPGESDGNIGGFYF